MIGRVGVVWIWVEKLLNRLRFDMMTVILRIFIILKFMLSVYFAIKMSLEGVIITGDSDTCVSSRKWWLDSPFIYRLFIFSRLVDPMMIFAVMVIWIYQLRQV